MKTLALLAIALALTTRAAFAHDLAISPGVLTGAPARVAALAGPPKEGKDGRFVMDSNTWQPYLHWHLETRRIQPAVCHGDCAARPTTARVSLSHPY